MRHSAKLFDEVSKLADNLLHLRNQFRPTIVGIGGLARSGKSTLAGRLLLQLQAFECSCSIISLDHWILPVNERPSNSSVIDRYSTVQLMADLDVLLGGNSIVMFPYDQLSRQRSKIALTLDDCSKSDFIIIEGVVALALEPLRSISDYLIFVEIGNRVRFRRLLSFYKEVKMLSPDVYRPLLRNRELEETPTIRNSKRFADCVILDSR